MKNIEARIRELQEIIAQSKEAAGTTAYDFSDSASVKAFQKVLDGVFKERLALIKDYHRQQPSREHSELSYERLERRKAAIQAIALDTQTRCKGKYPRLSTEETIAALCAPCPENSFQALNDACHAELAAAIWILDHLRRSDQLEEALPYLPQSREELDVIDLPNVTDSVHCDDLLRGMLYVIRFRNRGVRGFDASIAFMDDADTLPRSGAAEQDEDRKNFDAIISLIDPDTVSKIEESFLKDIRAVTDSCLQVEAQLHDRLCALTDEKIRIIEEEIAKGKRALGELSAPESEGDLSGTATVTVISDSQNNGPAVEEELRQVQFLTESFHLGITMLTPDRRHEVRELLGNTLYDQLILPKIDDPYTCCFGFLSLLDKNSDWIWGYNLPYIVLACACDELPWACLSAPTGEAPKVTPAFYEAATDHPDDYIIPENKSILQQRIVDRPFVSPRDDKITFSQLVYLMSGMAPPRGMPERSYIKSLFSGDELNDSEKDLLYEYFTLACSVTERDEDYVFIDEEAENETVSDETQTDDYARELKEIKRENKGLKAIINKLEHRLRESGEALRIANDSLEEANAELAELRSMIRQAEKTEEAYTASVTFPYTARKRAVVFGGHESWAKAIRPLLPNVRFTDASARPNTGLIMNADVVWIQTNALSHSSFYKIIDIVRTHHIELRYFRYASAEKCAEQFALDDMEQEQTTDES